MDNFFFLSARCYSTVDKRLATMRALPALHWWAIGLIVWTSSRVLLCNCNKYISIALHTHRLLIWMVDCLFALLYHVSPVSIFLCFCHHLILPYFARLSQAKLIIITIFSVISQCTSLAGVMKLCCSWPKFATNSSNRHCAQAMRLLTSDITIQLKHLHPNLFGLHTTS